MTAYPDGPLDLRAELLLGSAWTNVTQWAMPDGAQYADITGGTSDGASQPSPASLNVTWDNPDGRFSPRNASGPYYGLLKRNTKARISVAGTENYLRLTDSAAGASGGCPAISSGVLDVRLDFELADWRACTIAGSGTVAGSYSWQVGVFSNGHLVFYFSPDGSALDWIWLSPEWPLYRQCLRVTYDSAAGVVTFYSAPADSPLATATWTSLGSGSIGISGLHGSAGAYIGGPGGSGGMLGSVYRMSVYQGSTAKSFFDATVRGAGTTSWTDSLGNAWSLSGTAEISDRDYRLHGELASIVPSVDGSAGTGSAAVQIAGPLRRIQAGSAPPVMSPVKRGMLLLKADQYPVAYWPMEDPAGSGSLASALPGVPGMDISGPLSAASDTSFPGSAALPVLNGAQLAAHVPPYTDRGSSGGLLVRWLMKLSSGDIPASGWLELMRLFFSGSVPDLSVRLYAGGGMGLTGLLPDGTVVFDFGAIAWTEPPADTLKLFSIEVKPVSGGQQYTMALLTPGEATGWVFRQTVASGVRGQLWRIQFGGAPFTGTVAGHLSVQSAALDGSGNLPDLWILKDALIAYAGEAAGTRFARVCAENGYDSRILGIPSLTQPMGPQPVDTFQAILQDIVQADQGLLYEARGALALGYRTLASMYNQAPAAALSFAAANLPGKLQAADDDTDLINDWTASQPSGASARVTLDDPAVQTSTASAGPYQGTATANVATAGALQDAAGAMLARTAADEARVRQVQADAGIPGAPAAGLAKVRPGDLITLTGPPPAVQTADIRAIVTGAEELLGPGRRWTWDCQPASAYDVAVYDSSRADTDGSQLAAAVPSGANLLSDGGLESGSVAGWTANNCTAAAVTSPVRSGSYALQITPNGSGSSPRAASPPVPVTAGSTYSAAGWVLASAGLVQPPGLAINWYDSTGVLISSVRATVTPSTAAWTYATVSGAAPSGAVTAKATPQVTGTPAATEIAYWDDMALAAGTPYSLSVATTGPSGITWTTDPADLPFDLAIAGERVTVTAVTGTTSPQSMTVARAVNGVSKALPAGADVRLADTPRYAWI